MRDKQPRRSPEARLPAPRLADWGPTPETPAGRPHLKSQVGAHLEQRLAAPPTGPKQQTGAPQDSVPKRLHWPAVHDSGARLRPKGAGWACCAVTHSQSSRLADQRPGCLQGTTPTTPTYCQCTEPCRTYWLSRTKAEHPAEGSCRARGDCRLNNSKECGPGREKSETNPSNHPLPLHRQDTSRTNLTGLKPAEDSFFHSFFLPSFTFF